MPSNRIDISDYILFNHGLRSGSKVERYGPEKQRALKELKHLRTILNPKDRLLVDGEWEYYDQFCRGSVRLTRGQWFKNYCKTPVKRLRLK